MAKKHDPVNHPDHYTKGKYEVIDVLQDWFPTDPLLWQCGKYLARAPHKGNLIEDLEKMVWYARRRIAMEKGGRVMAISPPTLNDDEQRFPWWKHRVDELEAERDEARQLLRDYGFHSPGCSAAYGEYRCRCGWDEVEAKAREWAK